jgi:hypothetical protein
MARNLKCVVALWGRFHASVLHVFVFPVALLLLAGALYFEEEPSPPLCPMGCICGVHSTHPVCLSEIRATMAHLHQGVSSEIITKWLASFHTYSRPFCSSPSSLGPFPAPFALRHCSTNANVSLFAIQADVHVKPGIINRNLVLF